MGEDEDVTADFPPPPLGLVNTDVFALTCQFATSSSLRRLAFSLDTFCAGAGRGVGIRAS